jgi:hypothetical protein
MAEIVTGGPETLAQNPIIINTRPGGGCEEALRTAIIIIRTRNKGLPLVTGSYFDYMT